MFVKRKRDDNLKFRLVADGNMQIRSFYDDISSPTISKKSLFVISFFNAMENRKVITIDIEGAYLHADMNEEIYVAIEIDLASIFIVAFPEYVGYIDENGRLQVRLDKA